jgi:mono/diheme cytochrome c family protein
MHHGTEKDAPGVPAIVSTAQFGPNLTRIAAKLGSPDDPDSARRWLVQWIMDPTVHFPRTRMPITHLSMAEANDLAVWLLSQQVTDWTAEDLPAVDDGKLWQLAKVHLDRTFTKSIVVDIEKNKGISKTKLDELQRPADADERELEIVDGKSVPFKHKLLMFIGRKAVGQLGCYGCHYIPGYSDAKPIGTPLNEWGKKDPERLAFEDSTAFVHKHFHIVDRLTDEQGKPVPSPDGKPLYEKFFFDALEHHQREGFLHLKLLAPRSFDYDRIRLWDDRLRMPQFRFARVEPKPGEPPEEYRRRSEVAEAEAREAVMTFILGLVAEPIPAAYVHKPRPDRLAEIKGREVLDRFNCAGCHLIRPGVYEFAPTTETMEKLTAAYHRASRDFAKDHFFADHSAWVDPRPPVPGKMTALGLRRELPAEPGETPEQIVTLTEALRLTIDDNGKPRTVNLPAFSTIDLPRQLLVPPADRFGGTFADLLGGYLRKLDRQTFSDEDKTLPTLPPPLLREGEKTQPLWLFNFLRDPTPIRPANVVRLRMPKFNLSDDDAKAIVNYFAAVDRVTNPAFGLEAPYYPMPIRNDAEIGDKTRRYVERLKISKLPGQDKTLYTIRLEEMQPVWEQALLLQAADAKAKLQVAEAQLKQAEADEQAAPKEQKGVKAEAVNRARGARDNAQKTVDQAQAMLDKKDVAPLRREWEQKQAYLLDGFRLIDQICLACHQIGPFLPKEKQGPPLDLAWQRLRPEWTLRWLANPGRFMRTSMPQNFPKNQTEWQDMFPAPAIDQVHAARDALLNYDRLIDFAALRTRPISYAGTGEK